MKNPTLLTYRSVGTARQFSITRIALLIVLLALSGLAFQGIGEKVLYESETTISQIRGSDGKPVAIMSAGAGTIVAYDGTRNGLPALIGFATKGIVEGKYGADASGPQNHGRVIYKQSDPATAVPYSVVGPKDIYIFHLKYLELTSAVDNKKDYGAYATKAIAFDNKVETLSKQPLTFTLPPGGQLAVPNGKIKIGDYLISPNYDLSGKIP